MEVFGHRGSRIPGPENTSQAVVAAFAAGADGVGIDVRRSADGVLVCVHDAAVGDAQVHRAPAVELTARGVPTVAEVLDAAAGRGRVVCEVNNVPWEPAYDGPGAAVALALLDMLSARAGDDVIVSSFDWFSLEAVRRAGGPPTAFRTPPGVALPAAAGYARGAGHAQVHPYVSDVLAAGAGLVAGVRAAGLGLVAWTVTDITELAALAALGVPAVICDDPAACRRALDVSGEHA